MKNPVTSYSDEAIQLCKALGEDPNLVREIYIELETGNVMTARIEKFVEKGSPVFDIIKKVAWVEVDRERVDPTQIEMADKTPMKLTKEMIDDVPEEIIDKTKRMIEDGCREILDGKE